MKILSMILLALMTCPINAAIRGDADADMLSRTTNLPSQVNFTMMCWAQRVANGGYNGTTGWEGIIAVCDAADCYYIFARSQSVGGTSAGLSNWLDDTAMGAFPNGEWHHFAMTNSGTGAGAFLGYFDGQLAATKAGNSSVGTTTNIRIFDDIAGNEWFNGRVAAVKIYNRILSQAEIQNEMKSYMPRSTQLINSFFPGVLAADGALDKSGLGRNLTIAGTFATEDGPPISWW